MPVEPIDFETHSERAKDDYTDEIAFRCIISRKYYYVFHSIREENQDHNKSKFTGYGDHGEASEFMARLGYKDLADKFDDLRTKRNEADYDLDEDISDMDLAMYKNDVEEFVTGAKRNNFISR
jgi:hypothetical protein